MSGNPDKWLNNETELSEDNRAALRQYRQDATAGDGTVYDNMSRVKQIIVKGYAPNDFDLGQPSAKDILAIINNLDDSDEKPGTKHSYKKALKAFYRDYRRNDHSQEEQIKRMAEQGTAAFNQAMKAGKHGPHYGLVQWFSASKDVASSTKVEPWMILSPDEAWDVISSAGHVRAESYFSTQYSCAATSGEAIMLYVHDVDLVDESIYIRGNKQHRSKQMELLNETLEHLRNYLKWHPAVDDPFDTDGLRDRNGDPIPLWVKKRPTTCRHCDQPKTYHGDPDTDACNDYRQKEWEAITGQSFFSTWRDAVDRSNVTRSEQAENGEMITEDQLKMKHLRKSMLTRFASNIDQGVKEAQLRRFARWKPGQGSPEHYIELAEEVIRGRFRASFKGEDFEDDGQEDVLCHGCNTKNDASRNECVKCHRPLNPVASAQEREVLTFDGIGARQFEVPQGSADAIRDLFKDMKQQRDTEELIERKIEEKLAEVAADA